mgnify:FL=1
MKKKIIYSSLMPLIILITIGCFIGNNILEKNNTQENNNGQDSSAIVSDEPQDEPQNEPQNNPNDESQQDEPKQEEPQNEIPNNSPNNSNTQFNSSVAFIGDSRTQGFIMYNGLKDVQDYSYIGLMVDTAVTKKFVKTGNGEKITLLQDMANKNIETVYIMLGVNELGWSYPQVFKTKYGELIDEIRKIKPNCKIYVQSIIPMTKSKSETDRIFNNKNVNTFNNLIQELAKEKNVTYLDVKSALVDANGYLPEEASSDGVHVDKEYCKKWFEYLKNNS